MLKISSLHLHLTKVNSLLSAGQAVHLWYSLCVLQFIFRWKSSSDAEVIFIIVCVCVVCVHVCVHAICMCVCMCTCEYIYDHISHVITSCLQMFSVTDLYKNIIVSL